MRRLSSFLLQAVESASIALATLLTTLVPAFVAFAVGGLAGDGAVPWRVAVDVWLLGHGADLGITLGDAAVAAVGTDAASAPFVVGIGAWGIGLLTVLLAARSGMRLARTPAPAWGLVGGVLATAAVGAGLALSAQHPAAAPNVVHAAVGPALCMLVGLAIGALWESRDVVGSAASWMAIDRGAVPLVAASLRAGLAAATAFVGLGAVLLAVTLIARQADVILLFEALQPDHLGVVVVWLVQLALLPTAIVWSTAWMLGPGFAIGAGSSVSPLGTDLGPVPTLPLLGAVVPGVQPWSLVIVVAPLVAAIAVGAVVRQRATLRRWWESVAVALGGGIVAGLVLAGLAAIASGGIGPGRLDEAGPTWWLMGAIGAGIAAVGLAVGLLAGPREADALDDDRDGRDEDEDGDVVDDASLDVAALAAAARARGEQATGRVPTLADEREAATPVVPLDADAQETAPVDPIERDAQETASVSPADRDAQETAPVAPLERDAQETAPVDPIGEDAPSTTDADRDVDRSDDAADDAPGRR
ncbi:hypothetical protein GCM10009846_17440 [Agrococcus versicolor]|uniref:Integral membrane protein n=1 Tax=Agrococcus versicolor TaxID=501482 RepID=A0ABN3ARE2_9MICO